MTRLLFTLLGVFFHSATITESYFVTVELFSGGDCGGSSNSVDLDWLCYSYPNFGYDVSGAFMPVGSCVKLHKELECNGDTYMMAYPEYELCSLPCCGWNDHVLSVEDCDTRDVEVVCPEGSYVRQLEHGEPNEGITIYCYKPTENTPTYTGNTHGNPPRNPTTKGCPIASHGISLEYDAEWGMFHTPGLECTRKLGTGNKNVTRNPQKFIKPKRFAEENNATFMARTGNKNMEIYNLCNEGEAFTGISAVIDEGGVIKEANYWCTEVTDPTSMCEPQELLGMVIQCDNSDSSNEMECSYSKTIGVSESKTMTETERKEMTFSMEFGFTIEAGISGFSASMSTTIGQSELVGYEWSQSDTTTWTEETTVTATIKVKPHTHSRLDQLIDVAGARGRLLKFIHQLQYKMVYLWIALLCISPLALGEVNEAEARQGWTYPPDWTGPTLPPDWEDWSPGGPFPTLGPGVTLIPPDLIANATVTIPKLGTIKGAVSFTSPVTSPDSRKFYWFAGIPYADPTSYTGNNRFKPSKIWNEDTPLPTNNNGVFSAINPLIWCPQVDILPVTTDLGEVMKTYKNASKIKSERKARGITPKAQGVEECLMININTPVHPEDGQTKERLPVVVFIHGGSFDLLWGGIFGGHRFLNRDIVFVTINYRLGILGALNLGIDDAPGNAAMYDIVESLKWVKKYIHHFGGDPSKVTVTGHSAGAAMAALLLTSPLSIDPSDNELLLHGLITMSGSSLSVWATCEDPMTHNLRTAHLAGCYDNSTGIPDQSELQGIRNCMANLTVEELIDAVDTYSDLEQYEGRLGYDAKAPSLQDPSKLTIPIFMSELPYDVMKEERQHNIPVMLGATRHDGTFVMEDTYGKFLLKHNYTTDPLYLKNEMMTVLVETRLGLPDPSGEMIHSLGNRYLGEAMHTDDFESKIPGLIDIHSVFGFKAPAYQLVEMHSKKNPHSYYFGFEYSGMWSVDGGEVIPGGVGHVNAVFYLFQAFPLIVPQDQAVAYRFVDYWANFAIYGNPNGEGPTTLAAPYNPLNHAFLKIDSFDSTGYYCRDSWVNNSLEIMKWDVIPEPTDGTTSETPGTTDGTTSETTQTTTNDSGNESSGVSMRFDFVILFIAALFQLIK
ncbi:Liver carboxylesterase [Orchesella cincta]|uniref:Liver carboxylesterase n=1 Tax=Orchesella cincta TaxID=48709 RepID=A0A1D2MVF0_ORCCI|nr:Liver carboxylesterase [Orchesella cincta]